ncbi:peptide chain release factor N(5)-glutamine methyltransferase [Mycoplasma corogypsi]|uniref:peptide chain release factor N(5)-glutamine methyltransferase n=1 Tax=Mycoplasma corogypsi TaxID=2106 RepID=UPI003872C92D
MPTLEQLLLEKRRYGLEQTVSSFELEQLKKGTPIQKIIGYIEMADVKIDLSKKVLIPRYETEELIYLVKEHINDKDQLNILDLCCGSGFIGIALQKFKPNCTVTMSDIDHEAILQSQINQKINNVKVNIIQSDLFEHLPTNHFDIIVSNPPYIKNTEILDKSVLDFEPHHALFAPDNGLYFYKQILKQAPKYFKNQKGLLFFEINALDLEFWNELKNQYKLEIIKDIAGLNRIVKITFE